MCPRGSGNLCLKRRSSKRHGLMQHAVANQRIEALLGDHFNAAAKQILEVENQSRRKPGTGHRCRVDQEVDVALWARITSRNRAEQPDVSGAMPGGNALDVIAFRADKFSGVEKPIHSASIVCRTSSGGSCRNNGTPCGVWIRACCPRLRLSFSSSPVQGDVTFDHTSQFT